MPYKNPSDASAWSKKYYQLHKSEIQPRQKIRIAAWWAKNPDLYLYSAALRRSRKQNLEFTIDREDILIPLICPYLGIPIRTFAGDGTAASLDRIDNTKGYVKGNIEVISMLANRMKSNATPQQLITFAKEILKRYEFTNTTGRSSDASTAHAEKPNDTRSFTGDREAQADSWISGEAAYRGPYYAREVEQRNPRRHPQSSYLGSIPAVSPMVDSGAPTGHGADSGTTGFSFREDPNVVARWEAACRRDAETDYLRPGARGGRE